MSIPDYQSCMLPLLNFASDNKIHSVKEAIESLSQVFELTEEERKALLPSGTQFIFDNRVGWARTYLKKAGLLMDPKKGSFQITEKGFELLKSKTNNLDIKSLVQFEIINNFTSQKNEKYLNKKQDTGFSVENEKYPTPEEALEYGYEKVNETLANDLLEKLKECSPSFFEKIVVDLLVKIGYGGNLKDASKIVGKSGDGGIDGIIKEDKLGLDVIYVQAKRWDNVVGRPEIQKFAGALLGQKAKKGIFITTSGFTTEAISYCRDIDAKIILIDGAKLTELMIEYNLGVAIQKVFEIKRLDSDYFIEE